MGISRPSSNDRLLVLTTTGVALTDTDAIGMVEINGVLAGSITVTIPSASNNAGRRITISRRDVTTNTVIIASASGSFDWNNNLLTYSPMLNPGDIIIVESNGTYWKIIGYTGLGQDNYIINGGLDFYQRGTFTAATSAVDQVYWVDRFRTGVYTVSAQKQVFTTGLPNNTAIRYARIIATSGNANAAIQHTSYQEGAHVASLAGKVCTISAWVRSNNANARLYYYGGSSVLNSVAHSGSGNWEYLSTIVVMPSTLGTINTTNISVGTVNNLGQPVNVNNGDYVDFTQAALNLGTLPIPFVRAGKTIEGELIACQRYYEKSFQVNVPPAMGSSTTTYADGGSGVDPVWSQHRNALPNGAVAVFSMLRYRVNKFKAANVSIYGTSDANAWFLTGPSAGGWVSIASFLIPNSQTTVGFSLNNEYNQGSLVVFVHWTADAEI